jgi:hypothetical protein
MYRVQYKSENGQWEFTEEHKKSCEYCKSAPEGTISFHGQEARFIDECGNTKTFYRSLFEGIEEANGKFKIPSRRPDEDL